MKPETWILLFAVALIPPEPFAFPPISTLPLDVDSLSSLSPPGCILHPGIIQMRLFPQSTYRVQELFGR